MKTMHLKGLLVAVLAMPIAGMAQDGVVADGDLGAGNITEQLTTGMFLNPTAAGQDKGSLVAQYCLAALPLAGDPAAPATKDYEVDHWGLLVYGLTDWLEVGGQFLVAGSDPDNMNESAGGQLRVMLLQGDDAIADVSVGGVFLFNDTEQQVVYAAASKNIPCPLGEKCPCNSIVVHVGGHHTFRDSGGGSGPGGGPGGPGGGPGGPGGGPGGPGGGPGGPGGGPGASGSSDDTIAYVGLEIPVSGTISLIGEIQTKADADTSQPFAVGFQTHTPDGFACTLAAVQTGSTDGLGVFLGIGIPFN